MAQYYEEKERSQLGEQGQETPASERDNDWPSDDRKNEVRAEGYNVYSGEPETVTYNAEEIRGRRSVHASAAERDGDAFEQPSENEFEESARDPGRVEGKSDYSSDRKGDGNQDTGYSSTVEQPIGSDLRSQEAYSEEKQRAPNQNVGPEERTMSDIYEQPLQTQDDSNEETPAKQPGRTAYAEDKLAEEQIAPNQDLNEGESLTGDGYEQSPYNSGVPTEQPATQDNGGRTTYSEEKPVNEGETVMSDGYEQSPYTKYESKADYDRIAYGGQGYQQPKPKQETGGVVRGGQNYQPNPEQQQTECAEPRSFLPTEAEKGDGGNQGRKPKENLKAKVLETLIPCHKTDTLDDDGPQPDGGVVSSPGLMGKLKQKLTGETREREPEGEAAETSPKKNVFEKVKEKLSPST